MSEHFIPRDRPKSWVVMICAALIGLLAFGPALVFGHVLQWPWVRTVAFAGFVSCWAVFVVMWVIVRAKHSQAPTTLRVAERSWKDQVW